MSPIQINNVGPICHDKLMGFVYFPLSSPTVLEKAECQMLCAEVVKWIVCKGGQIGHAYGTSPQYDIVDGPSRHGPVRRDMLGSAPRPSGSAWLARPATEEEAAGR